ncbi:MAG: M1 family metallopeptidase [Anaerolineae bacterium]|nr:M1 family metallopeptidase [Anaerolineae bacterium]
MLLFLGVFFWVGCNTEAPFPTLTSTPALGTSKPTNTPSPSPTVNATPTPPVTSPDDEKPQYTLDIALNYEDRRMAVTQTVLLRNTSPDPWSEVVFAVPPAHYEGVWDLHAIVVTTGTAQRVARYTLAHTMLHVRLPKSLPPGEPLEVELAFTIHIPPVAPTDWLPAGNLGAGSHLIQAGDWHPTLVPYQAGKGWKTWEYYLVGDPNIYSTADYTVTFMTDSKTVIAAPGTLSRVGQMRRYRLENARCFAFLAGPEYRFFSGNIAGVAVRVYYLPGYAEEARSILDTLEQAIPSFIEYFGPYPTTGLIVAQNAYLGAMEYSGLVSMSNYAFEHYDGQPLASLTMLTAHELAHQWWYGAVGNDQVHEPWLDESLAKYSESLFYERYYPESVGDWWERHILNREIDGPLNSSIYDFDATPEYVSQVYAQGARFLAAARETMGDEDFFAFLLDYRTAYEGRIVTGDAFLATLYAHTDKNLGRLLGQYFEFTGNPLHLSNSD